MSLRSNVIRLAHGRPDLRPHLLPVLASMSREAIEFPTPAALKKYLKDHPKADPSKHTVKKTDKGEGSGGEAPKSKKVSLPKADATKAGEILSQWSMGGDIFGQVGSHLYGGHAVEPEKLAEAHSRVKTMLAHPDEHRLDKQDVKELKQVEKILGKHLPNSESESKPKLENLTTKTYKKSYPKAVSEVMDKHKLTDDDADQVRKFKKQKPRKGDAVSDAELMRRFMAKAKPETKERMKDMTPAEFKAMLAAISEDEEGGKTASEFRAAVIRLAHANPDLRPHLLPVLASSAHQADETLSARADYTHQVRFYKAWWEQDGWEGWEISGDYGIFTLTFRMYPFHAHVYARGGRLWVKSVEFEKATTEMAMVLERGLADAFDLLGGKALTLVERMAPSAPLTEDKMDFSLGVKG